MNKFLFRDYEVHLMVVDFERQGGEELRVEADAENHRARMDPGEEAVVEAASATQAAASQGERETGDEQQVYFGRRDHGALPGVRLEEVPHAWAEKVFGMAAMEIQCIARDPGKARDLAGSSQERSQVRLGGLGGVECHGAGEEPFGERLDTATNLKGSSGAGLR
jgi:hypothetical protein